MSGTDPSGLQRVYSKITWRILPFLFICYLFAYLDRVNIGFAKLQMQQELSITEAAYGLAAGIFFLGYVLFEVPSNLLLTRIGARKTLSRILVLWGITSACMMLVRDASSLNILRFLLGVFEAGFAPGMLFYLSLWYSPARLAGVTAAVLLAAPVASLIGGPLSGWIMSAMHGSGGLSGWQWMFLVEGVPAVLLGVVAFMTLTDSPQHATWLTPPERELLHRDIGVPAHSGHHQFGSTLRNPAVYKLAAVCFCIISGIYTVSFWLPTLLQGAGVANLLQIGLYSAIPYVAAAVMMIVFARRSDRQARHRFYLAGLLAAAALCLAITAAGVNNFWVGLIGITLASGFLWSALPVFWALPSEFFKGPAAAGAIALINSLSLLGGFVSPLMMGYLKGVTGSLAGGLWAMVVLLLAGALLPFTAWGRVRRQSLELL